MVFVSSPKHIKELDNAPDTVLSLNGAAKHVGLLDVLNSMLMLSDYGCEHRCFSLFIQ